jgi:putative transposase
MGFDPDRHHRQSIRLSHFDYSRVGTYFVTACTQNRECLLGEVIEDGKVRLSPAGRTVEWTWNDLPRYYPHVLLDAFVVMPNHVHGILVLKELEPRPRRQALSEVVRAFKSFSARRINKRRSTPGLPVWQRNYYERVIRDEDEMAAVRRYIIENPLRWATDPENLQSLG